jgi:hypothetical protein
MGRRSLDATKLLCSLIVRAAVDFLRGACPFADDFFWLEDDEDLFFFLADEGELLGFLAALDGESWAGSGLLCSNSSAARIKAVNRLRELTRFSVTRLRLNFVGRARC